MRKSELINLLGVHILALVLLSCNETSADPLAGAPWTEPQTGVQFVWIPSGCFEMGGTDDNAKPIHKVCVKGFWMGRYEVTQAQYKQVMGKYPSRFRASNNPVETIAFEDAREFTEEMSRSTGTSVRLPSEAEWEYACRAGGSHKKYCGEGEALDLLAWHDGNSGKSTHAVGQLAANDWGLYDMNGNVSEWTQDCWNPSYSGAPVDGSAWMSGDCVERMVRGGSMTKKAADMSVSSRYTGETLLRYTVIGFRVARQASETKYE